MDPVPDAVALPAAQIVIDRLPRRQVVRQQTPRHPGSQKIEDGIDQFPSRGLARASARFRLGDQRRDQRPLPIRQVGRIGAPTSPPACHPSVPRIKPTADESRKQADGNRLLKHALKTDMATVKISSFSSANYWPKADYPGGPCE